MAILASINQQVFQNIAQAIKDVHGQIRSETSEMLGLRTHNSKHFLTWDQLFTALIENFEGSGLVVSLTKKSGPWQFVLLYDIESKSLISILKDKRLADLKLERQNRLVPHYQDALNSINIDKPAIEGQEIIEGVCVQPPEYMEAVRNRLGYLCEGIPFDNGGTNVDNHVVICFDESLGNVSSITAYVLNFEWDIVDEKDISDYIALDIGFEESQLDVERVDVPKLKLKDKALDRAGKSSKQLLRPIQEELASGTN